MSDSTNNQNVLNRAEELDLNTDVGMAFVPVGLYDAEDVDDLSYYDEAVSIQKLASQNNVDIDTFVQFEGRDTSQLNDTIISVGTIYIAYEFLINNFAEITTLLQLIERYYSRARPESDIEINFRVEEGDGETRSISYEGPVENVDQVLDDIAEIGEDNEDDD